jgi:hypothetical protein
MFSGTVEFSSGVAVGRKVTLIARTLSDLTSQGLTATDCTLSNSFVAATSILYPLSAVDDHGTAGRSHNAAGKGSMEQVGDHQRGGYSRIGNGPGAEHGYSYPDGACRRRDLSYLERGQLSLHADCRLRDVKDRHYLE